MRLYPRLTAAFIQIIFMGLILTSCGNKSSYVPVNDNEEKTDMVAGDTAVQAAGQSSSSFTIPFKQLSSGCKTIHVKFNDSAGFDALFDTGCSGVSISLQEARSLYKSGTLTESDYRGSQEASIASGQVMVDQVYNIHQITVVDLNGKAHTLEDIPAHVVENPAAPILIGSSVIDRLANDSIYTVDLSRRVIIFN